MKKIIKIIFILTIFILGANAFSEAFKDVFNKEIYQFKKFTEKNPNNPAAYIKLGKSYLSYGKYNEAIKNLTIASKLEPNRTETYYSLGKAYGALVQHKKKILSIKKCL